MMKWKWTRRNFYKSDAKRKRKSVESSVHGKFLSTTSQQDHPQPNFFPPCQCKESRQNLFANSIRKRDQSAEARGRFLFWRLHERDVHVSIWQDENVSAGMLHGEIQSHILPRPRPDAEMHDESVGKFAWKFLVCWWLWCRTSCLHKFG